MIFDVGLWWMFVMLIWFVLDDCGVYVGMLCVLGMRYGWGCLV